MTSKRIRRLLAFRRGEYGVNTDKADGEQKTVQKISASHNMQDISMRYLCPSSPDAGE